MEWKLLYQKVPDFFKEMLKKKMLMKKKIFQTIKNNTLYVLSNGM